MKRFFLTLTLHLLILLLLLSNIWICEGGSSIIIPTSISTISSNVVCKANSNADSNSNDNENQTQTQSQQQQQQQQQQHDYRSITELNEYGSSPQINNARLASTLHGTLTIVALSIPSNCIIVTSLQRKLPGVLSSSLLDHHGRKMSSSSKIHILAKEKSHKVQAVIGSGLQSDLSYIVSLLRKHINTCCWERYDSLPTLDRITLDTSEIMTCFMGYNVNDEIRDGTKSILYNYDNNGGDDEDETISIGRPLACNLLFVEVTNTHEGIGKGYCDIKLVDPGGIISQPLVGQAIGGRGSNKANELLRQQWNDELSMEELEERCIDILRQTVQDENLLGDNQMADASIVCEVLTVEGIIENKRLPFLIKN